MLDMAEPSEPLVPFQWAARTTQKTAVAENRNKEGQVWRENEQLPNERIDIEKANAYDRLVAAGRVRVSPMKADRSVREKARRYDRLLAAGLVEK